MMMILKSPREIRYGILSGFPEHDFSLVSCLLYMPGVGPWAVSKWVIV